MRARYRFIHWLRTSLLLAHFWQWQWGPGNHCPWCWLCERFPKTRLVIPYTDEPLIKPAWDD